MIITIISVMKKAWQSVTNVHKAIVYRPRHGTLVVFFITGEGAKLSW